jgi:hypothetical protein
MTKRVSVGSRKGAADLSALAAYAARIWLREDRAVSPTFHHLPASMQTAETARSYRADSVRRRERASLIRIGVQTRNFLQTLELMAVDGASVGVPHFCFLERAFSLMTTDDRAFYLRWVWCRSKLRVSSVRALRLFCEAPALRETVPAEWPSDVRLYRGARADSSLRARRIVQRGVSWTTDRAVALTFAKGIIPGDVGCLGSALVARASILAFFMDPDTMDVNGVTYPVESYHEHECIIDPSMLTHIEYEAV